MDERGGNDDEANAADLASMGVITVGDLLSTTARAIGARLPQFVGLALLVLTPVLVLRIGLEEWAVAQRMVALEHGIGGLDAARIDTIASFGRLGVRGIDVVLTYFAQATLMYTTVEYMAGRRASVRESLRAGLANFGAILGLAVLSSMAVFFSFLACVLPAVVVYCILFASVPAAVVERLGPIDAMQRSAELTGGHRMTLFMALFVIAAAAAGVFCVSVCGLAGLSGMGPEPVLPSPGVRAASYVLDVALSLFWTMSASALAAVFYARVRGIRDGVDADAIAREFE